MEQLSSCGATGGGVPSAHAGNGESSLSPELYTGFGPQRVFVGNFISDPKNHLAENKKGLALCWVQENCSEALPMQGDTELRSSWAHCGTELPRCISICYLQSRSSSVHGGVGVPGLWSRAGRLWAGKYSRGGK